MYETINRELGIKSCTIEDITDQFLEQWQARRVIGSIMMFYGAEGYLIINKSDPDYSACLHIAQIYLTQPDEIREQARRNSQYRTAEILELLEKLIVYRRTMTESFHASCDNLKAPLQCSI